RRVVEEMPDLDARSGRAVPDLDRRQLASMGRDLGACHRRAKSASDRSIHARLQRDLPDAGDRRQRLAAKAHGGDGKEIVGGGEFAGGVIGEGELEVVGMNAVAVVHDADKLAAALFDVDVDARRAGVEAVFQKLLDDAGGPLDDFAGSYFGDDASR